MAGEIFHDKGDGTRPNKKSSSLEESTNQPRRRSTKGQTGPQKPQKRMLKLNIIINISLLVPYMALGTM